MKTRCFQSPVRSHWPFRTYVGFSIVPSSMDPTESETFTVRRVDAESFDRAMAGISWGNRGPLRRLHRHLIDGAAPGYLVCGPGDTPLVACLRIPGGLKTQAMIRQRIGSFVPQVGEREHLLADLWIAPGSSPTEVSKAITALVHVDPPGHLARTVFFLPRPIDTETRSALSSAGAQHYIYCVRQRCLPAFWRNRHDWIGPAQLSSLTSPDARIPERANPALQPPLQAEEEMK